LLKISIIATVHAVFTFTPSFCVLRRPAANTNSIAFGLT